MLEYEDGRVIQKKLPKEFEDIDELPSQKRTMSPRTRFLLRINGLLQQKANIEYALAENEELAIATNQNLEEDIEWQKQEISRYDNLIQLHKNYAVESGYTLIRNPRTGRFIVSERPAEEESFISKKIKDGINAYFNLLIDELNQELIVLDNDLIQAHEKQIHLAKERKYIDLSEQFKKIEILNDIIDRIEHIRSDLFNFLNNFKG